MTNMVKRCLLFSLGLFMAMTIFITIYTVAKTVSHISDAQLLQIMKHNLSELDRAEIRKLELDYLINLPTCKIANYDFNSDDVKTHLTMEPPIPCTGMPFLFEVVLNRASDTACIAIYESVLRTHYHGARLADLNCTYVEALRNTEERVIDHYFKRGPQKRLPLPVACIPEEYIWITCHIKNVTNIVYHQPVLVPKVKSLNESRNEFGSESHQRDKGYEESPNKKQPPLNVIILGIDALSRLALYRTMPKTVEWLHSKPNRFVEMMGYSKVGLNSAPNIFALLFGRSFEKELKPKLQKYGRYADGIVRYLWEDFADAGYRTMFLEEQGEFGIFVYPDFLGFEKVPVDHWPKPLMQLVNSEASRLQYPYYCMGPELRSSLYLEYTYNLLKLHGPERPLWTFTWLSILSHGGHKGATLLDQPVLDFLTKLDNDGIMERSIILFLADHGFRHGPFRQTEQGRLEDSLPFGFILLPPLLNHPYTFGILKRNSERLVTAYDFRQMLLDVLDIQNPKSNLAKSRTTYGVSPIREEVDYKRTCEDAAIPLEYCPCSTRELYNNTELANVIGEKAIAFLNFALKNATRKTISNRTHICSPWALSHVAQLTHNAVPGHSASLFQVNIVTAPKANFDVTVTVTDSSWTLNEVVRIDRYGEIAACATGRIQQYCYCVSKHSKGLFDRSAK